MVKKTCLVIKRIEQYRQFFDAMMKIHRYLTKYRGVFDYV